MIYRASNTINLLVLFLYMILRESVIFISNNYCKDYMESLYLYCSATTTKIIWKVNAARPVTTFSAPDRISGSDLILAGRAFLHEQVFSVSQAFDNKISSFKKFDENVCALESGIGCKIQTNL